VIRYALSLIKAGWKKHSCNITEKYISDEKKDKKKKLELLEISLVSPKSPYFNSSNSFRDKITMKKDSNEGFFLSKNLLNEAVLPTAYVPVEGRE